MGIDGLISSKKEFFSHSMWFCYLQIFFVLENEIKTVTRSGRRERGGGRDARFYTFQYVKYSATDRQMDG